jgi:hypothetical protein
MRCQDRHKEAQEAQKLFLGPFAPFCGQSLAVLSPNFVVFCEDFPAVQLTVGVIVAQVSQPALSPISKSAWRGKSQSWRVWKPRYGRLGSLRHFGCGVSRAVRLSSLFVTVSLYEGF